MSAGTGGLMNEHENFSITDPAFVMEPFGDYDWMVEAPVWRDPITNFWVVTRYEDVRAVATNPAIWSNRASQVLNRKSSVSEQVQKMYATEGWLPLDTVVSNDPPEHKFYRSLIDKALTPAKVAMIMPFIETKVDSLMKVMFDKKKLDFIQSFAIPLTIAMLADQVGGAGPDDVERIRYWADVQLELINPTLSPERELEITRDVIEFQHFVACAIERVRAEPNDKILSALVHVDIDGRRLSVQEIIAVSQQFFVAGHDTTSSALGSAVRYLAENSETLTLLKRHPEKLPNFVEEILRLESPVQRLFRRATRDTEIGDVKICENDIAVVQWGGANRDGARFGCPHQMEVDRVDANRHLAFGAGIHFCVGNQLARGQLRAALSAMTQRCSSITLADGQNSFEYSPLFIARTPKRLDIVVTGA